MNSYEFPIQICSLGLLIDMQIQRLRASSLCDIISTENLIIRGSKKVVGIGLKNQNQLIGEFQR